MNTQDLKALLRKLERKSVCEPELLHVFATACITNDVAGSLQTGHRSLIADLRSAEAAGVDDDALVQLRKLIAYVEPHVVAELTASAPARGAVETMHPDERDDFTWRSNLESPMAREEARQEQQSNDDTRGTE